MTVWNRRLAWTIGPALGVVDSIVNHVPSLLGEVGEARADRSAWSQAAEFLSLILDAGWAWAAAAVLAGWLVTGVARSALAGAFTLITATVLYYATDLLFDGGSWWGWVTQFWLVAGILLGPLLGVAGALIHRPGLVGILAALVVPAGAVLQMLLLPPPSESLMAIPVQATVYTAAAVLLIMLLIVRIRSVRSG